MPEFQVLPTSEASQKVAITNPKQAALMNQRYPFYPVVSYADGSYYPLCGVFSVADGEAVIKGWKKSAKKSFLADILLRD